jgi:hypothetical protein
MRHCFITGNAFGFSELKKIAKLDRACSPCVGLVGGQCSVVILTDKPLEEIQATVRKINEFFIVREAK